MKTSFNIHLDNQKASSSSEGEPITQKSQGFFQQLQAIVDENLSIPSFSAKKLSQFLFMSYPTCLRKVKAATGMTIKEYIRYVRIHRAARLLKAEHKQNITSIAWEVGYTSNAHFSRDFRKVMGCSPTEYRKRWDIKVTMFTVKR